MRDSFRYEKVDLMLIDVDRNSRDSIKNVLHNNGLRDLRLGESLEDIEEMFHIAMPDLLIIDTDLPDMPFADFMAGLRHHKIGSNPFLPVIAITWNPTPDLVRSVIGAGADDLLTKPLSTAQLLDRITALVKGRKPFVVTSEYIGPDRRPKKQRESETHIKQMDVPNTLKAKATGDKQQIAMVQAAIDEAIREVNTQKMERHADQISHIVERIRPRLEQGVYDDAVNGFLEKLLFVAQDTGRRMIGTEFEHVSNLCQSLIKVTGTILKSEGKPAQKDVKLLQPLSQAIRASFLDAAATEAAAKEIAEEVGGDG